MDTKYLVIYRLNDGSIAIEKHSTIELANGAVADIIEAGYTPQLIEVKV